MDNTLYFEGKKYISAKRAAEVAKYTSDYVGQLCRAGKLECNLVGRTWYVSEESIIKHKESNKSDSGNKKENKQENKIEKKQTSIFLKSLIQEIEWNKIKSVDTTIPISYEHKVLTSVEIGLPLFPQLSKKTRIEELKINCFKNLEEQAKLKSRFSSFEKRVSALALSVLLAFVSIGIYTNFDSIQNSATKLTSTFGNNFTNQQALALSSFSNGFDNFAELVGDVVNKILSPWNGVFTNDNFAPIATSTVIVVRQSPPALTGSGNNNSKNQALSALSLTQSKNYIDASIDAKLALFRNEFLTSTTLPNVNRYYITNQNDRIVDLIGSSSGGSSSSIDLTALSASSPLVYNSGTGAFSFDFSTANTWTGLQTFNYSSSTVYSSFIIASTTNLNTAFITLSTTTVGTLKTNASGIVWIDTSSGTAASSTLLGDTNYWSGSNTFANRITFPYSSSTIYSSYVSASTTNLIVNGESFNDLTGTGLAISGGVLTATGLSSYNAWSHPGVGISATTSQVSVAGLLSTASSTFSSSLFLPSLSQGVIYNGSSGLTQTTATGTVICTGLSSCGSTSFVLGGALTVTSSYDAWTHPFAGYSATSTGFFGIGTTTPLIRGLTVASSTILTDGIGIAQWVTRNAGGNLYFATSTVAGTATTSTSALWVSGSGFGTTTIQGLAIVNGQATSTSNVGLSITSGCFAISGTCLSGSGASTTLLADSNTFSGTNNFTARLGLASSTPFAKLSLNSIAGEAAFVIGSSTATSLIVNSLGNVGVGTALPVTSLHVTGNGDIAGPTEIRIQSVNTGNGSAAINLVNNTTNWGIGNYVGELMFYTGSSPNTGNPYFRLSNTGNLAVGAVVSGLPVSNLGIKGNTAIGTNYYTLAAPTNGVIIEGNVGIGTSTPLLKGLTVASSTILTDGVGIAQWVTRNAGGNLYFATSTVAGTATSSISALEIAGDGFGTTTLRGFNISGQATSTSNVGFNITTGCYAISGACLSSGSGLTSYDAWTHPAVGISATTSQLTVSGLLSTASSTIVGNATTTGAFAVGSYLSVASSSPFAQLSVGGVAGVPQFAVGSSTGTSFIIDKLGNVGVGMTNPIYSLHVLAPSSASDAIVAEQYSGGAFSSTGSTIIGRSSRGILTSPTALQLGDRIFAVGARGYGATGFGGNSAAGINFFAGENFTDTAQGGYLTFVTTPTGTISKQERMIIDSLGKVGIGTSTPFTLLQLSSTTASATFKPQLALSDYSAGVNAKHWTLSSQGGNFYIASATDAYATTSDTSALSISGSGFGTTTLRGLNISGQATSTSNIGFNITSGCFAISNTCVGGSSFSNTLAGGGTATTTFYNGGIIFASSTGLGLLSQSSATTNFFWDETNKRLGLGTSTPFAKLSVNSIAGEPAFTVGSSTATSFIIDKLGNVGVGTTSPMSKFAIHGGDFSVRGSSDFTLTTDGLNIGNGAGLYFTDTAGITFRGPLLHDSSTNWIMRNTVVGGSIALETLALNGSTNTSQLFLNSSGNIGIGTTTPFTLLQLSSTTASATFKPQLALSDYSAGVNAKHWTLSSQGGNFYIASATDAYATTSDTSALSISGSGFGTTTLRGLNISGQATSTSNVGFNITTGCYAISGTCVGGGGGGSGTVNSGTFGQLAFYGANGTAVSGTSTITVSTTTASGRVGIATSTNLNATLTLQGAAGLNILNIATTTSGANIITISEWGGITQKVSSSTALSIQMASGTPVFEVDTTSNTNSGIDITAGTGQTSNLLNFYSSGGSFLSGFTAAGGLFMNLSSSTAINLYDGSNNAAFVVNSTGRSVGIGTSTLAYNFTVQGSQASTYIARIDNAAADTTADGLLITLGVANASRTTGNYFIGFADGSQTVAGKIQGGASAVAYTTSAADIAEYFRVSEQGNKPEAGEIVMLDPNTEKGVKLAGSTSSPQGSEIEPFGIISTNPGFIGNGPICKASDKNCDENYAETNVLVALAGQVPLKVTSENGVVQTGDYLTLSKTIPGVAMKMTESGYSVGQALTNASSTIVASTTSVVAFVKNQYKDMDSSLASATSTETLVPSKWRGLFSYFKTIGFEIGQNFVKITNLVTDKLTAETVYTKQLCIEEICVTKDQLQALILDAKIILPTNTSPGTTSSTSPSIGEATTTPEVVPTSSSQGEVESEAPVEVEVVEPEPAPVAITP